MMENLAFGIVRKKMKLTVLYVENGVKIDEKIARTKERNLLQHFTIAARSGQSLDTKITIRTYKFKA